MQTYAEHEMTGRLRPVLISNDGVEYGMDTDQMFVVLQEGKNAVSKKYKVMKNIVLDDRD